MNVANQNQSSKSINKSGVAGDLLNRLYKQSNQQGSQPELDNPEIIDHDPLHGAGAAFAPESVTNANSSPFITNPASEPNLTENSKHNGQKLALKKTKSSSKWMLALSLILVIVAGVGLVVFTDLFRKKETPTAPVSEPSAAQEGACTLYYHVPLIQCADFGCVVDSDCDVGLECSLPEGSEDGTKGYCSEPDLLSSCQADPTYDNCCIPPEAIVSGSAYCLETNEDPQELPLRFPIASGSIELTQRSSTGTESKESRIPLNTSGQWMSPIDPWFSEDDVFDVGIILNDDGVLDNGLPYSAMTGPRLNAITISASSCSNPIPNTLDEYIECVIGARENHTRFDFIYSNCLLPCGQAGCTDDDQCQEGLVCITHESDDGEITGYCSETKYKDACSADPTVENCCSEPPITNTPTPSVTPSVTPTSTPGPSATPTSTPSVTPSVTPTSTPGPQPTPPYATPLPTVPGKTPKYIVDTQPECNDKCDTNADCRNISHICYNGRCRLDVNPEDEYCRTPAGETYVERIYQPPVAGPRDWLNYLKIGVGAIGAGLLLLLLL
ncbi:MAG: hypothetical protein BWY29_00964 [Microgenomates group bacterium ADurb.Bin238]|nr:MAG: hypothetical protein BWY29_00964 [Microgenomates group bacterium ADurb.Bin238]